jgi:hypothetical protein
MTSLGSRGRRSAVTLLYIAVLLGRGSLADQPPNTIASFSGVRAITAFYNEDDHYSEVLVGVSDGTVHELFYSPSRNSLPADHGEAVIATFDKPIVALAGFHAKDDHFRIAIVATGDGSIHEFFYHPDQGKGQSVIGNIDGIVAITAFYNEDDQFRVVLVATRDGNLHEIFYHPTKGRGESVIATYPGIRAISGYFDPTTS